MKCRSYRKSVIAMTLALALSGLAPTALGADRYPDYNEDVFMEWELEKNLSTPVVEKPEKKIVSKYMKSLGEKLHRQKYKIELMREGEVVILSLPTDELFAPNDTLLSEYGERLLKPLLSYFSSPYMFKLVYTINTDDTGSDAYLESLSDERNASVYAWFMEQIDNGLLSEDLVIIPYSMGKTAPVASNDSWEGRAKNRRVEFYIIPGPEMIEKACNKTLKHL